MIFSGIARFHFRPLIVRIPSQVSHIEATRAPASLEELQSSPSLETENGEIEKEMSDAEYLLNKGANIAIEESETDTVSRYLYYLRFNFVKQLVYFLKISFK